MLDKEVANCLIDPTFMKDASSAVTLTAFWMFSDFVAGSAPWQPEQLLA